MNDMSENHFSKMPDHDRIVRLEAQMERYNSDIESEKRGRSEHRAYVERKLDTIDTRFIHLEAKLYKAIGMGAGLFIAADAVIKVVFNK